MLLVKYIAFHTRLASCRKYTCHPSNKRSISIRIAVSTSWPPSGRAYVLPFFISKFPRGRSL
jgi:hypothetical protein